MTALVERRLTQLSPAALKLARVAALAGADFGAELAAAVLELHPLDIAEPWRELEAAQVIREGAFAHDLILEATRASVPGPIAELLHERIARHLAAHGASSAVLAPHWAGAAQWLLAGEAHVTAARDAQGASQRGHEVEHWERAAQAFDRAGLASARSRRAATACRRSLSCAAALRRGRWWTRLLERARSDIERASALTAQAMAALMAADHAAGIEAALQAAALAHGLDAPALALEAACLQAVGLAQAGRAAEGLAIIEAAIAPGSSARAAPTQRGRFWADYAYALNAVRRLRDTAIALSRRSTMRRPWATWPNSRR